MMKTKLWLILSFAVAATVPAHADEGDNTGPSHNKRTTLPESIEPAPDRERMALSAGTDGGVLPSLLIEAEDRIAIRFDRPQIALDLVPRSAPGLDWQESWDQVDLFPAAVTHSAFERPHTLGRPWLDRFAHGEVVVGFRPAELVESRSQVLGRLEGLQAIEVAHLVKTTVDRTLG